MKKDVNFGFVGAGNMATALVRGLLRGLAATPETIRTSDVDIARCEELQRELGTGVAQDNAELASWADIVVVAVKPQVMPAALASMRDTFDDGKLLVSIAAGTSSQAIEGAFHRPVRVVRAMPNTPALVGAGATAIAAGSRATEEDMQTATRIFSCVGLCTTVDESKMDAVTGLSGSGPAYVMLAIEALADGGVRAGLPRPIAQELAAQTVFGSAKLALATHEHPAVLKDRVASPGGTTISGLHELERHGFRNALISAVVAAAHRATELGR